MKPITDEELTAVRAESARLKMRMDNARKSCGETSIEFQYTRTVYRKHLPACEQAVLRWIAQGCKNPTT